MASLAWRLREERIGIGSSGVSFFRDRRKLAGEHFLARLMPFGPAPPPPSNQPNHALAKTFTKGHGQYHHHNARQHAYHVVRLFKQFSSAIGPDQSVHKSPLPVSQNQEKYLTIWRFFPHNYSVKIPAQFRYFLQPFLQPTPRPFANPMIFFILRNIC